MADTMSTGTMLTEEGGVLPEFLRFESEPWTSFYMAGEMIREVRRAQENEASTRAGTPEPEDHRRDEEASPRMDDVEPFVRLLDVAAI